MIDRASVLALLLVAPTVAAQPAAEEGAQSGDAEITPAVMTPAPMPRVAPPGNFVLSWDGYLRVVYTTIQPDRFLGFVTKAEYKRNSPPTVGRNDGLSLDGARLNLRGTYGRDLYVRLSLDGSVVAYPDDTSPVGELSTGLKDAYVRYTVSPALAIAVGRFKPPFDVEELTPTENQFFVQRALESRGVARHEGPHSDLFGQSDVSGFAPGRQMGVMVTGAALPLGVDYALAITNGNSGDASLNDNDLPALWLRLSSQFGDRRALVDEEGPATYGIPAGVAVGLGAFYNEVSTGIAPTRFRDRIVGVGFDAAAHIGLFHAQAQALVARTDAVTLNESCGDAQPCVPAIYAVGGHAQVAMNVPGTGFFPAYRIALLDPRYLRDEETAPTSADDDRIIHQTLGARFVAQSMPAVFHLEYTYSQEQGGRVTANHRVEAAMQVTF